MSSVSAVADAGGMVGLRIFTNESVHAAERVCERGEGAGRA